MAAQSNHRLEMKIERLDRKVDILLGEAEKTMSPYIVIVLIVIAVVAGIWSEYLLKKFKLLENQGKTTLLLFSIVAIIVIILFAYKINTIEKL